MRGGCQSGHLGDSQATLPDEKSMQPRTALICHSPGFCRRNGNLGPLSAT